jgi:hypothetical protein
MKQGSEEIRKLSGFIMLNKKVSDDKKPEIQNLNLNKIPVSSNLEEKNL